MTEESAAYRAGVVTGTIVRGIGAIYVVVLGVFIVAAGSFPERARIPLVIGLVFFGSIFALIAAFTKDMRWASMVVYIALVGIGARLQSFEPRPDAALVAVAVGSVLAAVAFMVATIRRGRQQTELERQVFTESTSIAFFVTMIGAITYGLLEAWIDLPELSMWVPWSVGMGTWFVLSLLLQRRYS